MGGWRLLLRPAFAGQVFLGVTAPEAVALLAVEWTTAAAPVVGPFTRAQVAYFVLGLAAWAAYVGRAARSGKAWPPAAPGAGIGGEGSVRAAPAGTGEGGDWH